MTQGGARNRSGPQADPSSLKSAKIGLSLRSLEPFEGDPPEFPLPDATNREIEVWEQAWRTPQASAWVDEPWRWRTIAMWTRWSVRMEDPGASASLGNVVIRFADQIGLTPAGLKENGWKIDEAQPAELASVSDLPERRRSRDRFKAPDGGA